MSGKFIIIGLGLMLWASTARSQCIERDTLIKQLAYLEETTTLSDAQKLAMLLNYVPRLKVCKYRDDSIHCSLLSAIALMYHQQSDHFNAIHYYKQAIELASGRTGGAAVPARNLVEYYSNLSEVYDSLNKVPEKLACLDSAIAIGIRSPDMSRLCLWCMYSKLLYYYDVGDYRRCIEYASTCEKFGKKYAR